MKWVSVGPLLVGNKIFFVYFQKLDLLETIVGLIQNAVKPIKVFIFPDV